MKIKHSQLKEMVKEALDSVLNKEIIKFTADDMEELHSKGQIEKGDKVYQYQASVEEATKRDYKTEYKKFQSSDKSKKYRAELNAYNRKRGTYGNGDKKDASHKGGKIVGFEKESVNRGRAEKSRLKKESTKEYGKTLKKIARDRQMKMLSKKDKETLIKIANLMKEGKSDKEHNALVTTKAKLLMKKALKSGKRQSRDWWDKQARLAGLGEGKLNESVESQVKDFFKHTLLTAFSEDFTFSDKKHADKALKTLKKLVSQLRVNDFWIGEGKLSEAKMHSLNADTKDYKKVVQIFKKMKLKSPKQYDLKPTGRNTFTIEVDKENFNKVLELFVKNRINVHGI